MFNFMNLISKFILNNFPNLEEDFMLCFSESILSLSGFIIGNKFKNKKNIK